MEIQGDKRPDAKEQKGENPLIVRLVEASELVTDNLGISQARKNALIKQCIFALLASAKNVDAVSGGSVSITSALHLISTRVRHANELAYCSFVIRDLDRTESADTLRSLIFNAFNEDALDFFFDELPNIPDYSSPLP